jgi:RNA polymerase sigma factor (sigma-70 family)
VVTPLLTGVSDAARAEIMQRATERGYVLCSELLELEDPEIHPDDLLAQLVDEAESLGITVVDDTEGKPTTATVDELGGLASDPVRQYLNEASRYELLDAEQEADLAKRYLAGRLVDGLAGHRDPTDTGTLGLSLPVEELERIRRLGYLAKDKLIRSNLRLVVPTARRYAGDDLPMTEALQEGNLGLMRAVEKFDHTKGYKFSTYAVWWIRQAIQRALTSRGRAIRVPISVWEQSSKVRQVEARLRTELGRDPEDAEVAQAAGISLPRLREIREALQPLTSLDRPVGEDAGATMGELVRDERTPDPETLSAVADIRARIIEVLTALPERDRAILELRYGLRDGEPKTLEEISGLIGLSRERIRRIEKEALGKLRDPAVRHGLEAVFDALAA